MIRGLFLLAPFKKQIKYHYMRYIIIILLFASCSKQDCEPPKITGIIGGVVHFQPAGNYTIEVQGLDNPYHGFVKVSGTSYFLVGESYKIRIKSQCSNYSEWVTKSK